MTSNDLSISREFKRTLNIKKGWEEFLGRLHLKESIEFKIACLVVFEPQLSEWALYHRAWAYLGETKSKWNK